MKQHLLDVAELVDAWRVFPRIFLIGYGVLGIKMAVWAMSLPTISTEQAGLVAVIAGLFVPMTNFYMNTGKRW